MLRDFTDPTALLFSLVLFFQFGNEWSVAGWLAIFLIRRLGVSPATALLLLALYWTALLTGRILAQLALGRFRHNRLLASSAIAALFGCLMLTYTPSFWAPWLPSSWSAWLRGHLPDRGRKNRLPLHVLPSRFL